MSLAFTRTTPASRVFSCKTIDFEIVSVSSVNSIMMSLRATGMLCLLGIGIGLGAAFLFHLIYHILRRKPSLPPTGNDVQPLPTNVASEVALVQAEAGDENAYDEVSSFVSLPESSFDCASNPDLSFDDELTTSICSDDDSVNSAAERRKQADDESGADERHVKVRRRRFGTVKETRVTDTESGNTDSKIQMIDSGSHNINLESAKHDLKPCDMDDFKSSDDCALPTELCRDSSFSSDLQQGLVERGDVSAQLSSTSLNLSQISTFDHSSATDVTATSGNILPNRTFRSSTLEIFDHSTPDERGLVSWIPRTSWMFAPLDFTLDSDLAPGKSMSCHDCRRDVPVASRSCMSVDLGEMSSIASFISEMVEEGKLDCNVMNNMEKIEVELNDIQVEMRKMAKRVGKLQSRDISQRYNLCPIDFSMDSVDDNFEVVSSPRRSSVCDLHRLTTVEPEAGFVWDYDFDVDVNNDTFDVKSSSDFDDESIGQLESFVRYRSQKVARDAIRRSSLAMSDAASRLSRSDSIFACLTPSYECDTEQKSCSLYDVNRRLSGQFVIPSLSD